MARPNAKFERTMIGDNVSANPYSWSSEQFLKVNHAGEYGAIHIYRAQIALAKMFRMRCLPELFDMLAHEQAHFERFETLRASRGGRKCHALFVWAIGGYTVGAITAIAGTKGVGVCTSSVESIVCQHLSHQLAILKDTDPDLSDAILTILQEEMDHRDQGKEWRAGAPIHLRLIGHGVELATEFAIWLSMKL